MTRDVPGIREDLDSDQVGLLGDTVGSTSSRAPTVYVSKRYGRETEAYARDVGTVAIAISVLKYHSQLDFIPDGNQQHLQRSHRK